MRVIAGSARRLLLKTIDSQDTRPTTDRIKETLFNMLQFEVPGIDFLDLFSGSGAIGIEAISRGSKRAVFVENNPKAVRCIQENIEHCKFTEQSLVMSQDYMSALNRLNGKGYRFGVVFMDPPYNHGFERKAMQLMHDMDYVDENTIFIVEADINDDLVDEITAFGYDLQREKTYKTNKHVFFKKSIIE